MPITDEIWTAARGDRLKIGDDISLTFERRTTFRLCKPAGVKVSVDRDEQTPLESSNRPAEDICPP